MPVVHIKYNPRTFPAIQLGKLSEQLPHIVSRTLTIPQKMELAPNDIQVWVFPPNQFDNIVAAVQIMIYFEAYRERMCNLEKRRREIITQIKETLNLDNSDIFQIGWVWLIPVRNSEFGGF